MASIALRTAIVYLVLCIGLRLMGQKQAGQLQPYEAVITLLIAEVAAGPVGDPDTPLFYGLLPALVLVLCYTLLNLLCRKSKHVRVLLCGRPSILIHNGRLCHREIRRMGYHLNDLMEQLRLAGQTDIQAIHYAILETNGQLSVLPYAAQLPLTPAQAGVAVKDPAFCRAVLLDGSFNAAGLTALRADRAKLLQILSSFGYTSPRQLLILTLSDDGDLFLQDMQGQIHTAHLPKTSYSLG